MVIRFKEIVTGKMVIYLLGIKRFSSVKALFKFNIIILKSVYLLDNTESSSVIIMFIFSFGEVPSYVTFLLYNAKSLFVI